MGIVDFIENLPLVGYVAAGVHALNGDSELAKRAAARCTNATITTAACVGGGLVGGPAGALAGAALGKAAGLGSEYGISTQIDDKNVRDGLGGYGVTRIVTELSLSAVSGGMGGVGSTVAKELGASTFKVLVASQAASTIFAATPKALIDTSEQKVANLCKEEEKTVLTTAPTTSDLEVVKKAENGQIAVVKLQQLEIDWGQDRRYWDIVSEKVGDHTIAVPRLIQVWWLTVTGKIDVDLAGTYDAFWTLKLENASNADNISFFVQSDDDNNSINFIQHIDLSLYNGKGWVHIKFPDIHVTKKGSLLIGFMNHDTASPKTGISIAGLAFIAQ